MVRYITHPHNQHLTKRMSNNREMFDSSLLNLFTESFIILQAFMLKRPAEEEPFGHAAAIMGEVFENAECTGLISAAQKRSLLQEMAIRLS